MKEEKFVELLLVALQKERVQKEICRICNQKESGETKEIERLKEENMKLLEKIEKIKKCLLKKEQNEKELEREKRALEERVQRLQQECAENKKRMQKLMAFENEIAIFELYESLEPSTKEAIANILQGPVERFVYQGANERNLFDLWDIIEIRIRNEKGDVEKLKAIFSFFFEKLKLSAPYEEYEPVGEAFDATKMIARFSSSGVVQEVLLKGIKSKNSGKIIKKAVVKVGR